MSSETTTARWGYCSKCGRPLTSPRSNAHSMGPSCWQAHLDSLSDDDRARETMRGYNWHKAGDLYMVVSPEHHAYQVEPNLPGCDCIAFQARNGKLCKHLLYIQSEVGSPAPKPSLSPQDGLENASAREVESFDVELGAKLNPPGYAVVRIGDKAYRVNWQRPFCTCRDFAESHEICVHIRAAQDEINRQAQERCAQAETPEAQRARVQAEIDEIWDER